MYSWNLYVEYSEQLRGMSRTHCAHELLKHLTQNEGCQTNTLAKFKQCSDNPIQPPEKSGKSQAKNLGRIEFWKSALNSAILG